MILHYRRHLYGPGGKYASLTGRDATRFLGKNSLEEANDETFDVRRFWGMHNMDMGHQSVSLVVYISIERNKCLHNTTCKKSYYIHKTSNLSLHPTIISSIFFSSISHLALTRSLSNHGPCPWTWQRRPFSQLGRLGRNSSIEMSNCRKVDRCWQFSCWCIESHDCKSATVQCIIFFTDWQLKGQFHQVHWSPVSHLGDVIQEQVSHCWKAGGRGHDRHPKPIKAL